jgi:hypothetical protein
MTSREKDQPNDLQKAFEEYAAYFNSRRHLTASAEELSHLTETLIQLKNIAAGIKEYHCYTSAAIR